MRDITDLFCDLLRTIVTKNILRYRMIRKIYIFLNIKIYYANNE